MKLKIFTLALAAMSLYSCGPSQDKESNDKTTEMNDSAITETQWVLEQLEGEKIEASQNGKLISFTLNTEENRVTGYAGCNSFFGSYELKAGNRLSFSTLGLTRMACPEGAFNESELMKVLDMTDNYRINGDQLELNVGKRAPLAIFKKVDKNAEPIVEKYWKLKTLEGQPVKMSKNQEKEIYFTLKMNENRVVGFAGCNGMSGTYKLEEGNRISFSQMATTMMACPDVDVNEADFLKVFELTDNYTINGDTLSLNVGRRAPLAVFEAVYL
ncbi:META domain-containing protein [Mesonia sp. MT50]|uniref:META domain-containing protein n=1 Tax=Mesonia profundi TaxID=3070998 RepID=A0ABU1A2X7_9FLAO|nr:META domain-containing protein [Mesonia profundi]MDQ7917980.1 META domain-containing protein [Mesonia profundi]